MKNGVEVKFKITDEDEDQYTGNDQEDPAIQI